MPEKIIYTIGHSNHPLDTFMSLLEIFAIDLLADIRSLPRSRFNPQFNDNALAASLAERNIDYKHFKQLGGRRRPKAESKNLGWSSLGLRAYADYMQTAEFNSSLRELLALAQNKRTAIMCAEKLPENCHRQLTSDALLVQGLQVWHILADGTSRQHQMPDFARVNAGSLSYPLPLFG